jgi:hypothetical protein
MSNREGVCYLAEGCVIGQKVCNGEWICDWVYVRAGGVGWGGVGWGGVGWGGVGGGGVCGCVRNTKALTHLHSLVKHLWALESSYCKKTHKLYI